MKIMRKGQMIMMKMPKRKMSWEMQVQPSEVKIPVGDDLQTAGNEKDHSLHDPDPQKGNWKLTEDENTKVSNEIII